MKHKELVKALTKPGADILASLTPEKVNILHMAVGVSGETGELLDAIKKHVVYGKTLDYENIVEELGDIEFYLEGLRAALGIERCDVIEHNVNKLCKRYASGAYSNNEAIDRADK